LQTILPLEIVVIIEGYVSLLGGVYGAMADVSIWLVGKEIEGDRLAHPDDSRRSYHGLINAANHLFSATGI
jgi:hypothetical protein